MSEVYLSAGVGGGKTVEGSLMWVGTQSFDATFKIPDFDIGKTYLISVSLAPTFTTQLYAFSFHLGVASVTSFSIGGAYLKPIASNGSGATGTQAYTTWRVSGDDLIITIYWLNGHSIASYQFVGYECKGTEVSFP